MYRKILKVIFNQLLKNAILENLGFWKSNFNDLNCKINSHKLPLKLGKKGQPYEL